MSRFLAQGTALRFVVIREELAFTTVFALVLVISLLPLPLLLLLVLQLLLSLVKLL